MSGQLYFNQTLTFPATFFFVSGKYTVTHLLMSELHILFVETYQLEMSYRQMSDCYGYILIIP